MDLVEIDSYLHSLRQLYGLLQNDGNGLSGESSENLDVKARLLLKNLLDDTTVRVFEAKLKKTVGDCLDAPTVSCSARSRGSAQNQQHLPFPMLLDASPSSLQGSGKDLSLLGLNSPGEETFTIPVNQTVASEQSMLSSSRSEYKNRKKRCRVCKRVGVKQLKSTEDNICFDTEFQKIDKNGSQNLQYCWSTHFPFSSLQKTEIESNNEVVTKEKTEKPEKKIINEAPCHLKENEPSIFVFRSPSTRVAEKKNLCNITQENLKKSGDIDYISNQSSEAIKQIESHIKSLQIAAENVSIPHKSLDHLRLTETSLGSTSARELANPMEQRQKLQKKELTGVYDSVLGNDDSLNQLKKQKFWRPSKEIRQTCNLVSPVNAAVGVCDHIDQKRIGITMMQGRPSVGVMPIEEQKIHRGKNNRVTRQNAEGITENAELLGRATNRNDHVLNLPHKFVKDYEAKLDWKKMEKEGSLNPIKNKENLNQHLTAQKEKVRNVENFDVSISETSSRSSEGNCRRFRVAECLNDWRHLARSRDATKKEYGMPHGTVRRPSLSDHNAKQSRKSGIVKHHAPDYQRKKFLKYQASSDGSNLSFRSVSNFTSWQDSESYGDTEEHSQPSEVHSQHNSDSTFSSEGGATSSQQGSWSRDGCSKSSSDSESYTRKRGQRGRAVSSVNKRYLVPRKNRHHLSDSVSCSESTEESPISSTFRNNQVASPSSSEKDEYPLFYKRGHHRPPAHFSVVSKSKTMTKSAANHTKPKKKTGRLKRLKDKLAIVFHHHHHHHHHHHNTDDNYRGKSLWKHVGREVFKGKNNDEELYGEQAAGNHKRSLGQSKNQQGHFHALVEGLLRHVRHSKKQKQYKNGIDHLREGKHGGKKVTKKLHWWQRIHNNGGVKMIGKSRIKFKYGNKKMKPRALPNMK